TLSASRPIRMPDSVSGLPTHAHEYLSLLAALGRSYYDALAVREPWASGPDRCPQDGEGAAPSLRQSESSHQHRPRSSMGDLSGRSRCTVRTIASLPWSSAHFATSPAQLIERCVLAGTSVYYCCPGGGSPCERVSRILGWRPTRGCAIAE